MRRSAAEKLELIRIVDDSELLVRTTLRPLGIPRSTFYGLVRALRREWARWPG